MSVMPKRIEKAAAACSLRGRLWTSPQPARGNLTSFSGAWVVRVEVTLAIDYSTARL